MKRKRPATLNDAASAGATLTTISRAASGRFNYQLQTAVDSAQRVFAVTGATTKTKEVNLGFPVNTIIGNPRFAVYSFLNNLTELVINFSNDTFVSMISPKKIEKDKIAGRCKNILLQIKYLMFDYSN